MEALRYQIRLQLTRVYGTVKTGFLLTTSKLTDDLLVGELTANLQRLTAMEPLEAAGQAEAVEVEVVNRLEAQTAEALKAHRDKLNLKTAEGQKRPRGAYHVKHPCWRTKWYYNPFDTFASEDLECFGCNKCIKKQSKSVLCEGHDPTKVESEQ